MERTWKNIRNSPFAEDATTLFMVILLILCIPCYLVEIAWDTVKKMKMKEFIEWVAMLTGIFLVGCVLAIFD